MSRPEQNIFGIIATIRRYWLRRQLLVFGALGLVMVLGWLLAMIVLDNLAMLSTAQLVLGWVLLAAGAAGWLFLFANRVVVRRPPGTRLALLYEARVPRQRNRLINAVQFLESRQAQHDPIAYAAVIENSATLDPGSAPHAIDPRPARRALLGLGVGVLLLAGYGGLRPQWAGNALARLVHPLAPAPHLMATEPVVTPGDVELVEGAPLTIEARVPAPALGHAPDAVYLEYRVAELDWSRGTMERVKDGEFRSTFASVRHPLAYRVRAGHSLSPLFHVTIQQRPRVEQLQLMIQPPEYAGGGRRELKPNVGDVAALQGSIVELTLNASVPLRRPWNPAGEWQGLVSQDEYHRAFFYHGSQGALAAVRWEEWKLHLHPSPQLFDLNADPGEARPVHRPQVIRKLRAMAILFHEEMRTGARPAGEVPL